MDFRSCENSKLIMHVKDPSISNKALRYYMRALTRIVETKVRLKLPEKFAIVFDSWTAKDTHYLSLFSHFLLLIQSDTKKIILCSSLFQDKTSQDARQHLELISFVLEILYKSLYNVICLIGDNCATNVLFCGLENRPLIGRASYRINF